VRHDPVAPAPGPSERLGVGIATATPGRVPDVQHEQVRLDLLPCERELAPDRGLRRCGLLQDRHRWLALGVVAQAPAVGQRAPGFEAAQRERWRELALRTTSRAGWARAHSSRVHRGRHRAAGRGITSCARSWRARALAVRACVCVARAGLVAGGLARADVHRRGTRSRRLARVPGRLARELDDPVGALLDIVHRVEREHLGVAELFEQKPGVSAVRSSSSRATAGARDRTCATPRRWFADRPPEPGDQAVDDDRTRQHVVRLAERLGPLSSPQMSASIAWCLGSATAATPWLTR